MKSLQPKQKKLLYFTVAFILILIIFKKRKVIQDFINKWLDVHEINGNNIDFSNTDFTELLKSVGWSKGQSYCMYLAKAFHLQQYPKQAEQINKILTGSTQGSFAAAKSDKTGTYTTITKDFKPGDILIFRHKGTPSTGHAALFVSYKNPTTANTFEGNTSVKAGQSQNNGGGNAKKERPITPGATISGSDLYFLGAIRKL